MRTLFLSCLASTPTPVCYDNEGGDSAGAGDGGAEGEGSGEQFSQEQVNAFLAEDRRKHQEKMKALEDRLQTTMQSAQLSQEEKDALQSSVDDLNKQLLTKEQLAAQEKKKLEDGYKADLKTAQDQAAHFENLYTTSTIDRALQDAAVQNDAFSAGQVVGLLRHRTKLVDGKPVVDFDDKHADTGEAIVVQLSPADTIKRMKELPEQYGNLFKSNVVKGMGGGNNGHQGPVDTSKLTPEQYRKMRQDNPKALGLK